ncbi:MAG: DUF4203 domain-containing protein [Propionibacteriaceae bacterium]|nr:DUF4203 domain-containing protein [Propionibacteriaceae bacterium]
MGTVWVGVAEIALGLVFCFLGHSAARVVLGLWGAVIGFFAGALLYVMVYQWVGGGWVAAVPDWTFSIGMALLLAWLSFAFYTVGVLFSMGAVGWGLGHVLAQAFHLPAWLTFSLALLLASGLVMAGWTLNIPRLLLIVLTAAVGAAGIIDGAQLLLGARLDWFDETRWRLDTATAAAWLGAWMLLVVIGIIVQSRQPAQGTLRAAYGKDD